MITNEQFVNGLLVYIENEVMAPLPTYAKWGVGAVVILVRNKTASVVETIQQAPISKSLGIVDDEGMIDANLLCDALKESANRNGKMQISYPVIGTLTFSSADVDILKTYLDGGSDGE